MSNIPDSLPDTPDLTRADEVVSESSSSSAPPSLSLLLLPLIAHLTAASAATMTRATTTASLQKPFVATRGVRRVETSRRAPTSVANFVCDQCGDDFTRGFNLKGVFPLFSILWKKSYQSMVKLKATWTRITASSRIPAANADILLPD